MGYKCYCKDALAVVGLYLYGAGIESGTSCGTVLGFSRAAGGHGNHLGKGVHLAARIRSPRRCSPAHPRLLLPAWSRGERLRLLSHAAAHKVHVERLKAALTCLLIKPVSLAHLTVRTRRMASYYSSFR